MKQEIEYWLDLELLNADTGEVLYAGNLDEIVSMALFHNGNDRHGAEEGAEQFDTVFKPALGEDRLYTKYFPYDEYGWVAYTIGDVNCDHLRVLLSDDEQDLGNVTELVEKFLTIVRELVITEKAQSWQSEAKDLHIKIGRAWLETRIVNVTRDVM